jgi:phosphoserine aminotransferase
MVGTATAKVAQKWNFSGGPGALPETVLCAASRSVIEVPGQGLSVLGISHRSAWFRDVVDEAERHIRELLDIPPDYRVLFLQGGGTLQFSMVAMTLLRGAGRPADYVHTGYWSGKAIPEARREGRTHVAWSGESEGFRRLPSEDELEWSGSPAYLHYASNETVEGLQFHRMVGPPGVTRVCDMSSDFLSRPVPVKEFDLIYAHAQKNLGPAGVTLVLVRDEVLSRAPRDLPALLDYRNHAAMGSVYNTPPVFAIYVAMLVARWLKDEVGGLERMDKINREKARRLYTCLDASGGFYRAHAAPADRSLMNVVFHLRTPALDAALVDAAEAEGFAGLAGHRTIGGVRASLYNAVTPDAVDALCGFLDDFRARHREEAP